ncbi:MAG: hypothetical protein A3E98_03760 [Candidatus Doudnabacteria bacterium RIFCSPHIGHO2_12_FULL_48_11]|uniref:Endonuclease/exonuclease/phosphatase domain-containing protein n=1 Tax=Candidatus Doudnabacteria bacterium RIFCSPHIGHO2_01_FULL_46_24 TaxID=1817825 RepID=A0A1F5NTJ3_9BACT|nr:MAG: hypothetical protein A2720_03750 [Candidatus Doudnabacteria bacterium RIFCSPHIGHO2_01_FULL_46_24]OGE95863.1 MAG: hypothetical protein A3E98_03760 [Candidatus Doudnabacteria bacterium RIFCSPHIGHO2_12_FULL_48_11]
MLKLVSYNLHNSRNEREIVRNVLDFASAGVNLFCLQEVRLSKGGKFIGDAILSALGPGWNGNFFLSPEPFLKDYGLGIVWKSEMDLVKFENLSFDTPANFGSYQRIINLLLRAGITPFQQRYGSLIGTFKIGKTSLRISNLHIDWRGGLENRISQIKHLSNYLKEALVVDGEIICGDFNTLGFFENSKQVEMIHSLFGKEFINLFPDFRATTTHFQHLDHIFARNLKIHRSLVHEVDGSDHFPLLAELSF